MKFLSGCIVSLMVSIVLASAFSLGRVWERRNTIRVAKAWQQFAQDEYSLHKTILINKDANRRRFVNDAYTSGRAEVFGELTLEAIENKEPLTMTTTADDLLAQRN